VDATKLRAWWFHKQGLDGSLNGLSSQEVLEKTGWSRSVGGSNPYQTLFARNGSSREDIDKSVSKLEIYELPSARGCTYVVHASHYALALKLSQDFHNDENVAVKFLGVTPKELDKLADRILKVLEKGPQDPRQLKESLGDAVRNLGEPGKKKGMTTTLPIALGKLQSAGKIRRVPLNGRLDQQRYAYANWSPSPLDKCKLNSDEAYVELARLFFEWIGPASIKEFQWFSALGVSSSNAAVKPLKLVPIESGRDLLILADELDAFKKFRAAKNPQYALLSCLDSLFLLRRNLTHLLDEKDGKRQVMVDKSLKNLIGLQDLPSNAIVDRGRVIGLWEFDALKQEIVWNCFVPADKKLKEVVATTEKFICNQLGDARSFSLDSPESRKPRIDAICKA
jgi:winged helix DNA-binding protein